MWGLGWCRIKVYGGLCEPRIDLALDSKSFAGEGGLTVEGGIPFGEIGRKELPQLVSIHLGPGVDL